MGRSHSAPAPAVRLVVAQGKPLGAIVPVPGPRFTIGRDEGCQLRPHNELVSRRHAEITVSSDGVRLRDLGSRNGTLVNGRAVTAPVALRDGDRLQVGPLAFTVAIQGAPAAASSDDEIASWLVADEDSPLPGRPSDVFTGRTAAPDDEVDEVAPRPVPGPRPTARASSDAASDLLKAMTIRPRPR